ncbi:MAG: carbohydrate ABC transporter permease [Clostridia bacterium]|nr:carbohydrate ABC transporter permease [Clostridia bacterium]
MRATAGNSTLSRSHMGNFFVFLFLLIVGSFMALPLIYTLLQSVKPTEELFTYPPKFYVKNPTFDNFKQAAQLAGNLWVPFSRYLFNSLFISVVGTSAYIVVASLAAYPMAKAKKLPGMLFISQLIVWTLLFRAEVTAIPQYIIIAGLGMVNTYWALLLPALAGTFGVFLMRQFMVSAIPDAILEAARIDGANEYSIFWKIAMPCVKPAWMTLIIFTFQGLWSTTGANYIYEESMRMLPNVLSQIAAGGIARAGAGSAVAVIIMIPPIIVFLISQSSVMETMAHSGIK